MTHIHTVFGLGQDMCEICMVEGGMWLFCVEFIADVHFGEAQVQHMYGEGPLKWHHCCTCSVGHRLHAVHCHFVWTWFSSFKNGKALFSRTA